MTPFFKKILVILAAGILISLGMITFSNARSQRAQGIAMTEERANLEQVFERYNNRLRRAAIAVEWQKTNATGEVMESSLLVRRYGLDADGKQVPLPVRRIVIPGARVCVDGLTLEFDSLFTEEFKSLRNVRLSYFNHVYAESQLLPDRDAFLHEGDVPDSTQIHAKRVTHEEMKLWRYVWMHIQNPAESQKYGVHVLWTKPGCRTIKNGQVYLVFVGDEGITYEDNDDPSLLNDILREALLKDQESSPTPTTPTRTPQP